MIDAFEAAKIAKEALEEKKAEDIKILDIKNISNIADCFVIAGGSNPNQLRAMASNVEENSSKPAVSSIIPRAITVRLGYCLTTASFWFIFLTGNSASFTALKGYGQTQKKYKHKKRVG